MEMNLLFLALQAIQATQFSALELNQIPTIIRRASKGPFTGLDDPKYTGAYKGKDDDNDPRNHCNPPPGYECKLIEEEGLSPQGYGFQSKDTYGKKKY